MFYTRFSYFFFFFKVRSFFWGYLLVFFFFSYYLCLMHVHLLYIYIHIYFWYSGSKNIRTMTIYISFERPGASYSLHDPSLLGVCSHVTVSWFNSEFGKPVTVGRLTGIGCQKKELAWFCCHTLEN